LSQFSSEEGNSFQNVVWCCMLWQWKRS